MSVSVGLDIAAKTVECVVRKDGRISKPKTYAQTPEGHRALIRALEPLRPQHVVMEATGVYYLDLAVALAEADLPVAVINPKSFHHFATLKLNTSKTDGTDAALLAEYGERMEPRPWTPPEASRLALRDVARQINRLTKTRTQAKNRLHALKAKGLTLPLLIEDEQAGIAQLEARLKRLVQAATDLIQQDAALSQAFAHLQAAKGIGEASTIALLGELYVLPEHLKAPQVVRHAGLDVRLNQSGSSVNTPGRLSKAGNAYLRSALYMPALSAVRHDAYAKAFYEALVARGKKKIQALCAVMRKYLTGLWACLKSREPFESSRLFSDQHLKTA